LSSTIKFFVQVHFINLFSQPANSRYHLTSFFALSIGVFWTNGSNRKYYSAFIHALVNFSFGSGELRTVTEEISAVKEGMDVDWYSNTDHNLLHLL
jgi:hypothetical protein